MHALPLASDPSTWFGALMVIVIVLIIGASLANTFGPIALVIAGIVKAFRDSAVTDSPGTGSTGVSVRTSSGIRVVSLDPGSSFGQALSAGLQRTLGGQLGQGLGQILAMAAQQYPVEVQLAPIVMAVEAARHQGSPTPVRQFLTDGFASRFPAASSAGIAHIELAKEGAVVSADHVLLRIDRGPGIATQHEYWSFHRDTSAVPDGTPVVCPRCGAPTAGDHGGTCRFCGATFSTAAPLLPQPTRWLLDDISSTPPPPALAA
jgi:hypothetical protein